MVTISGVQVAARRPEGAAILFVPEDKAERKLLAILREPHCEELCEKLDYAEMAMIATGRISPDLLVILAAPNGLPPDLSGALIDQAVFEMFFGITRVELVGKGDDPSNPLCVEIQAETTFGIFDMRLPTQVACLLRKLLKL